MQFTTFVVFGCFALLVIADFGGLRRPRAVAYLSATFVGVVLLTLGAFASSTAWSAPLAMFLVGILIQLAGVFSSYVTASQTALLLCFVLAVSVPTSPSELGARLGGWLLAGLVSTLSGVFFRRRIGPAVLRARLMRLEHAFWVVLGTLSVLRSNAFGAARTTVEALTSTVAGFIVGALFTLVVGASSTVARAALPFVVFPATYTSSAIGYLVSQAAFTVLVIMLFNLISPVGWRLGLARVEDVAVGAGISIVAGLLL